MDDGIFSHDLTDGLSSPTNNSNVEIDRKNFLLPREVYISESINVTECGLTVFIDP